MTLWNKNTLTETKNGNASDMNNGTANDATNQNVNLNNESTPYATIFAAASPATTTAAAIAPDAHFLSLGLKLDTEIFLKGNTNNMADKDTIETTPVPNVTTNDKSDDASQDSVSTE